jgi:hypothetical protein
MLEIKVNGVELFDDDKQEFSTIPSATLHLEHSLISISKWESKWHKPFLENSDKMSQEEIIDYIKCMTLSSSSVDERIYLIMSQKNIEDIIAYIQNPMTATWFSEDKNNKKSKREIITSELIYYWMVALQIPFECQKWHLNRLLTLVRVCNAKNEEASPSTKNKMSQRQMMARAAALNAQRQAKYHTKG